jgi:hypothetical protein
MGGYKQGAKAETPETCFDFSGDFPECRSALGFGKGKLGSYLAFRLVLKVLHLQLLVKEG